MFTGIITDIGSISRSEKKGDLRLDINCHYDTGTIKLGDSIACSGACLTVVEILPKGFAVELSGETVSKTAKNMWDEGKKLNLERAMKLGDTLDGHLVTGHIDGIAIVQSIEKSGDSHILTFEAPEDCALFIAQKGSVTLNGVSLTVNKVAGHEFSVNIIPHSWANTTFSELNTGDGLNLEIDIIARYVARLLQK